MSKPSKKTAVFIITLCAVLLPFALLSALIRAGLAAWLTLAAAAVLLPLARRFWGKNKALRAMAWSAAVIIAAFGLYFGRPDLDVSFLGTLTRETVRFTLSLPFARGDKMLDLMQKYADGERRWSIPHGFTLETLALENSSAELLSYEGGSQTAILQLHGGSYITGYMNAFRNSAVKYSDAAGGACVFSPDYRTAPEFSHPAALEDALNAWDFLLASGFLPENIIVVGDSAGGGLALALTAFLCDAGRELPRAVICMSPWADLACSGESYTYNFKNDPSFGEHTRAVPGKSGGLITDYAGSADLRDKYLSPVYGDFDGFPPLLLQAGSCEMLLSDSQTVYKKAAAAGVDVTLTVYRGMFHDFQLYGGYFKESKAAWSEIEAFITKQLAG